MHTIITVIAALCAIGISIGITIWFLIKMLTDKISPKLKILYPLIKEIPEINAYLDANEFDADKQPFTKTLQILRKIREHGLRLSAISSDSKKALAKVLEWDNEKSYDDVEFHCTLYLSELMKENKTNPDNPFEKIVIKLDFHSKGQCQTDEEISKGTSLIGNVALNIHQIEGVTKVDYVFYISRSSRVHNLRNWPKECNVKHCEVKSYSDNFKLSDYAILELVSFYHLGTEGLELNPYFIPLDHNENPISDCRYKIITAICAYKWSPSSSYQLKIIEPQSNGTYKITMGGATILVTAQRIPLNN
ncbi:hypothetical protein ENBRE01_1959 [Enteropsectra breve]|nr:hypothetical protein ENBRE01_1959 [Enteropsectra breve]